MDLLGGPHPRCGALRTYGLLRASHLHASHHGGLHASHRDDPSPRDDLANHHGVRGVHHVVHASHRGELLRGEHHEHCNLHERGVKSMAQGCGRILERVPVHGMDWLDEEHCTSSLEPIHSVDHSARSDQPSLLPFLQVRDQLVSQLPYQPSLFSQRVAEGQRTRGQMAYEAPDDVHRDVLQSVGHIHNHVPNHGRSAFHGTSRDPLLAHLFLVSSGHLSVHDCASHRQLGYCLAPS